MSRSEVFPQEGQSAAELLERLHSPKSELGLIGFFLLDKEHLENFDFLEPKHFYDRKNRLTFETIKRLSQSHIAATYQVVADELYPIWRESFTLRDASGDPKQPTKQEVDDYLLQTLNEAKTLLQPLKIGEYLTELYIKRSLLSFHQDSLSQTIEQPVDGIRQLLDFQESELLKIALYFEHRRTFMKLSELSKAFFEKTEDNFKNQRSTLGVPSGLTAIDNLTGGFQKSDLIVLAGRPSMGKTALAINMTMNVLKVRAPQTHPGHEAGDNYAVGFFSLEMSAEQLTQRVFSICSKVNLFRLRSSTLSQPEIKQLQEAYHGMDALNLFIDDTPGLTISTIRSKARRLIKQHPNVAALFIDYLQLIRSESLANVSNRVQEISNITLGLKNLAKELELPVIALSQLSRAVEARDDKRPLLSDLRESGAIEQDADVVMFIYREEYYKRRQQPNEGTEEHRKWQEEMNKIMNQAEVIIAKQRNGPVGNAKLYYDSNTTIFYNQDTVHKEEERML